VADVEAGVQRQGNGPPGRMLGEGGQTDPEMAVDKLLAGRARGGIMVQAGTLDAGAVALGRRVI
jgi:hypothetical protein